MDIDFGLVSMTLPDFTQLHTFEFEIPRDVFMNSNATGYVKSAKGQRYLNYTRTKQKQALVQLGRDAADQFHGRSIHKAFVVCSVSNPTNHRFDPPNAELTEKHILDGMVLEHVLEDDNKDVIVGTLFRYLDRKLKDHYLMQLDIYDLDGVE